MQINAINVMAFIVHLVSIRKIIIREIFFLEKREKR